MVTQNRNEINSTGVESTTKVLRTVKVVSILSIARSSSHYQELSSGWVVGMLALRGRFGKFVEVLTKKHGFK